MGTYDLGHPRGHILLWGQISRLTTSRGNCCATTAYFFPAVGARTHLALKWIDMCSLAAKGYLCSPKG